MEQAIAWAVSKVGKFTYSMYGSRTGADGTADCSGFVYTAIRNGGGSNYGYVPSTETLHDYLLKNGFQLIAENKGWSMQRGDVVIWGKKGFSAGSGGHTGICLDNQTWVECTGWKNGVITSNHDERLAMNGYPYWYVYRLTSPKPTPEAPKNPQKAHDEAVAKSPVVRQGNYIAKLDVFKEQPKGQNRIAGWMVPLNGAQAFNYSFLFWIDAKTGKELARQSMKAIPRPDVVKAYGVTSGGVNYGLDGTMPISKLKGHKVIPMFRRTNDKVGNTQGGHADIYLPSIYLTF